MLRSVAHLRPAPAHNGGSGLEIEQQPAVSGFAGLAAYPLHEADGALDDADICLDSFEQDRIGAELLALVVNDIFKEMRGNHVEFKGHCRGVRCHFRGVI